MRKAANVHASVTGPRISELRLLLPPLLWLLLISPRALGLRFGPLSEPTSFFLRIASPPKRSPNEPSVHKCPQLLCEPLVDVEPLRCFGHWIAQMQKE